MKYKIVACTPRGIFRSKAFDWTEAEADEFVRSLKNFDCLSFVDEFGFHMSIGKLCYAESIIGAKPVEDDEEPA